MIIDILEKDYHSLYHTLYVVGIAWVVVLIAMLVDLYFGIKKAKEIGEATSSEGFRRSINKGTYYYALMTFALLFDVFDVITPHFFPRPLDMIPFFSVFGALCLVLTEAKSVFEKGENKLRRQVLNNGIEMFEVFQKREETLMRIYEELREEKVKQDERQEKNTI